MKNIKPSELIRLALHDLEIVEKDPQYKVDMSVYHKAEADKCFVCFAGAVMAVSLHADPKKTLHTAFADTAFAGNDKQPLLYGLNYLRCGMISDAFNSMHIEMPKGMDHEFPVTQYSFDPKIFKQDMVKLAEYLATFSL